MIPQRNVIETLPPRAARLLRRALQWLDAREFALAERSVAEALLLAPAQPELLRVQAAALHALGNAEQALLLLQQAHRAWPDDAIILNQLGCVLAERGNDAAAVATLRRAARLAPEIAEIRVNLAHALRCTDAGRLPAPGALASLRDVIVQAERLAVDGHIEAAVAHYRDVLADFPDCVAAWSGLINLKAQAPDARDLAALARLYERDDLGEQDRSTLGFAYALALEAQRCHADVVRVLEEACALRRRSLEWNAATARRISGAIGAAFAGKLTAAADRELGHEIIFIVGMPRSGSTLVEHILAAHAEVEGAGEIGDLAQTLRDESRRRGMHFPSWVPTATAPDWERLGSDYLQRTAHWRQYRARSTDKSALNWQLLGAAHAMLPGARIVHTQRDPLETCWSCYKHDFGIAQPFSYDYAELAACWSDHEHLMRQWRAQFGAAIHASELEQLIEHPQQRIRALLEHCGLAFDPACLRSHETRRRVVTASVAQVRRPLAKPTVRALDYGSLLAPLQVALEHAARDH
ncbi:MAG: sulfotransferase [Dokdonella sp.]